MTIRTLRNAARDRAGGVDMGTVNQVFKKTFADMDSPEAQGNLKMLAAMIHSGSYRVIPTHVCDMAANALVASADRLGGRTDGDDAARVAGKMSEAALVLWDKA